MKQIWLKKRFFQGPAFELEQCPDKSEISNNEVLIDVHYSGINFADIVMRLGLYPDAPSMPFVPGYEVSGIVQKVGANVTKFRVGDSVVAGTRFGGYTSQLTVPSNLVFPLPTHLNLSEGAALIVNWITAYVGLVDMSGVKKDDWVLIDSASGGVGTIALQIASKIGAKTVGLTTSPSKISYIDSFGALACLHSDFKTKYTHQKFNVILNSQGGHSVREHYDQLAPTGKIVAYGMSSAIKNGKRDWFEFIKAIITMPIFPLLAMFNKNRGVFGLNVLKLLDDQDYIQTLEHKWKQVDSFQLRPHIDKIFPADEIMQAHSYIESKKAKGKVLIQWK